MERVFGTPDQFTELMQDSLRRGWFSKEEIENAIKTYRQEWETAT